MFAILGTLLGAISGGGIIGIFGSLATQFLKNRREAQAHRNAMEIREQHRLDKEMDIKVAHAQGSWDGLKESQKTAQAISMNSHKWSNDIKNLYRPFFTTMLWILAYFIFRDLTDAMTLTAIEELENTKFAKFFTPAEVSEMVKYIVKSTVFMASMAGAWWFGDRAQAPAGFKNL